MENKLKNYLNDEHLSIGTREYLRVLNAGGRPVESLPVAEARKVLADVQAAVEVDLSGIDEREREIVADGHALTLHLVRPHGSRGRLPYFVFIHGGGWVLGDYPTHRRADTRSGRRIGSRSGFRRLHAVARSEISAGGR